MKKGWIIVISVVVTLAVVSGVGAIFRGTGKGADKGTVVRVEEVRRGELVELVSAPGEIEPKTNVEISAKVSARIIALPYDEGAVVTKGDPNAAPAVPASVLVRLDSKDLESQLVSAEAGRAAQAAQIEVEKARIESSKANLEGTSASLKQAERDIARKKELLESQDISQSAFDESQCKIDELKAQYEAGKHSLEAAELNLVVMQHNLEAADARIEQAQEALSYTTIRSPIDGVVTRVNAEVGEMVIYGTMNNPGTVICEVADLSKMLLVAQVDEADIGKLEAGQKAKVYVQAYGEEEFRGTVETIALMYSMGQGGTKYFRTEIMLELSAQQLYSGLTAHVDIETRRHKDVIKVPSQAVLGRPTDDVPLEIRDKNPLVDKDKAFATVVYRLVDGKAVVTPVKTGPMDMTHTMVLEGLSEGEKIIVGPYKILEGLKHDQAVRDERAGAEKKGDGAADVNDGNDR